MSRKIEDLVLEMQPMVQLWIQRMKNNGVPFLVTETLRSRARQEELYAQGRTTPGPIVTWTLDSLHIEGKALDFVILKDGKEDWSLKNPYWYMAGWLAVDVGLEWGGNWSQKKKDFPHIQLRSKEV